MNCTLTQSLLIAPPGPSGDTARNWFWGCVGLSVALHLLVVLAATGWVSRSPELEKPAEPGLSVELQIDTRPSADAPGTLPQESQSPARETEVLREEILPSKPSTEPQPTSRNRPKTTRSTGHPAAAARGEATPSPHGNPRPEYPDFARRKGWQGECLLRVTVTPEGTANDVSVHRSSGYAILDQSAVAAVRRWRFLPRVVAGQHLASTIEVPVNFSLLDG